VRRKQIHAVYQKTDRTCSIGDTEKTGFLQAGTCARAHTHTKHSGG